MFFKPNTTRSTSRPLRAARPLALTLTLPLTLVLGTQAWADFVINDDLIVDGSACIGFDCVNGESFGFDTIRLKENNLRIKFDDTSVAAGFPRTDWQITVNESANGGAGKFSIDDVSGNRTPFTIEANARSHSLYVDDGGRVGIRTSTPATEIHVIDGDTATLRLQQDGSSGFAPQTWDVAGNETNFFVRDVSNGSTLPFRIRPGAPTSSIMIDEDGNVGLNTASPDAALHVFGNTGSAAVLVEETSGTAAARELLTLANNGQVAFVMSDTSVAEGDDTGRDWKLQNVAGEFRLTTAPGGAGEVELALTHEGNLSIEGDFVSAGTTLNVPDYVFAEDYNLMPLTEVRAFIEANSHLPKIPSAQNIHANGLNHSQMQMALLEKVEELTLYTLAQQDQIAALQSEIDLMRSE